MFADRVAESRYRRNYEPCDGTQSERVGSTVSLLPARLDPLLGHDAITPRLSLPAWTTNQPVSHARS
jgi:hypothetical protein